VCLCLGTLETTDHVKLQSPEYIFFCLAIGGAGSPGPPLATPLGEKRAGDQDVVRLSLSAAHSVSAVHAACVDAVSSRCRCSLSVVKC